ncbi:hypothetical protein [Hydrogenophaga palleronii]|uniref:hypothetical protein n=1 Tax=Hydrogenophaga palleronii TaxID=65655 RepID=UPI000AAECD34|nr:hypothetical protein [Hydrogenophaga palleronii]
MNRQPIKEKEEHESPHLRPQARICWTYEVCKAKQEQSTSCKWSDADPVVMNMLRAMCAAGNEKYGAGSHWIELHKGVRAHP